MTDTKQNTRPDATASNPNAVSVRIEPKPMAKAKFQRRHDFRIGVQPAYVDGDRSELNRLLMELRPLPDRDAVQVSFVYDAAQYAFKDKERQYQRAQKKNGQREDVQRLVENLATSHPGLAGPSTMHALDEMITALHDSAPWMSDVAIWLYRALRAQYSAGTCRR